MLRKLLRLFITLLIMAVMGGCAQNPGQNDNIMTKEEITNVLDSNSGVSEVTWSPDEEIVLYLLKAETETTNIYAWKTHEDQPQMAGEASPGFLSFNWAPNSQYFLASETLGEGVVNRIYNIDTLTMESKTIDSLDVPIWSPDSKYMAFGFEQHEYGDSWGSLKVYELGQAESEYIWNAKNYLYKVEYWDEEGNIGYLEIDEQGQQSHKITQNIRPSISGVHLGDTAEQVKTALGEEYTETPPGEETMHFPEPVYRWKYAEGYDVFIGQDTGKVWEIMATAPEAGTNLGVKIGDPAEKVWEIYRSIYIEPISIHGGKLYGIFKVEGAAALVFRFNLKEGAMLSEIKPDNKVVSMDLTYPNILDDDF